MICKNCSAQIPDGSKFCTVCGHKIVVEPFVAPKPQQPPQTEPTQVPPQAPYTQIPPQVQQGHVPPYNLNGTQQQTVSKNTALDAPLTVLDFFSDVTVVICSYHWIDFPPHMDFFWKCKYKSKELCQSSTYLDTRKYWISDFTEHHRRRNLKQHDVRNNDKNTCKNKENLALQCRIEVS